MNSKQHVAVVAPATLAAVTPVAVAESPHPTWNDDERSSTSTVYHTSDARFPRQLWKDVLWGREYGHDLLFDDWKDEELVDTSRYVDFEFDSGCGSPVTDHAESILPWDDIETPGEASHPET